MKKAIMGLIATRKKMVSILEEQLAALNEVKAAMQQERELVNRELELAAQIKQTRRELGIL